MPSFLKTTLFVGSIITLSLIVFPLFAPATLGAAFGPVAPPPDSGLEDVALEDAIKNVIQAVLGLVAVIAVAALIIGGFRYITAFGDEDGAAKGKKTVLYALVGLIIVGLSAIIVNFVTNAVGGN